MRRKCALLMCVAVFVCSFLGCANEKLTDENAVMELPVFEWHAKWIWGDFNENDSWLLARKEIVLDEKPDHQTAFCRIACDSKYWLYVNGILVVRDGEMKRGQSPNSSYYDTVDVSDYLEEGENTIALRVWYWGADGSFSYVPSGHGGLLFQLDYKDLEVISDESWLVKRDAAFSNEHILANYRLPERDIWYDASLETENWTKASEEELSGWDSASVLGNAGEAPFGELVERTIPMFCDSVDLSYENEQDFSWANGNAYKTSKTERFEMKLPYNMQVYPSLEIDAPKGIEITMVSDMREDVLGDSVMTTYVTKEGKQKFETFGWMNGENIIYEIPAGVTIKRLSYTQTGYPTELEGSFWCDDSFYNTLWEKSQRSVYVNMRDTYMDCPNRERACWLGDTGVEMLVSMYGMDRISDALFYSDVLTAIGNRYNGEVFYSVNPSLVPTAIQMQVLMSIPEVYEYYVYTGNEAILKDAYEPFSNYLEKWEKDERGLYYFDVAYPRWEWGDSTENLDYEVLENSWYYGALSAMKDMSVVLGMDEKTSYYRDKMAALKEAYQKEYWTGSGFKSEAQTEYDERANAVAVVMGIAQEEQYDTIASILEKEPYYATPFLEYYVENACCMMHREDLALSRMKTRYKDMVEDDGTTLWEYFSDEIGTKTHGWGAGAAVILSRYIAGIAPIDPGYETYQIAPNLSEIKQIKTNVITPKGEVKLKAEKSEDSVTISFTQPADVKAYVRIEKLPKKSVTFSGDVGYEPDGEDESYYYYYVTGTDVTIISK